MPASCLAGCTVHTLIPCPHHGGPAAFPGPQDFRSPCQRRCRALRSRPMTETTLRTGEEWHRILGDAAPGFLWITDAGGRIVYANQTWQQYTGSSVEEINTRGRAQFNHPDEAAAVAERWSRALEQ